MRKSTRATFWRRVTRGPGCWEWSGRRSPTGYGEVDWAGGTWRAHRLAWVLSTGPIPAGMHVLHRCDNPGCVNPYHLFLGTHDDNMRDKALKGRAAALAGEAHPNAKLSELEVARMRRLRAIGARHVHLAAIFDVHESYVRAVVAERARRCS